jgi:thymidylate synthase (FAD)
MARIKFWSKPAVQVLGVTKLCSGTGDFDRWFTNDAGNFVRHPDFVCELGGRVCYDSFGKNEKSNAQYIQEIIEKKHFSVLEHASVTFGIQGISRACSHELVRHRHLSFSQRSQRYCNKLEFVFHPGMNKDHRVYLREQAMETSAQYDIWLKECTDDKQGREIARMILPNYVETKMVVSGNLRGWMEFLEKRLSPAADAEIRRLAETILSHLLREAPNTFNHMVKETL